MTTHRVTQLYPPPQREVDLQELYLRPYTKLVDLQGPQVYTNFIVSLDGRIALEQPVTGRRGVPESITNPRDWSLYQELAARADVLLISARYLREWAQGTAQASLPLSNDPAFERLKTWRAQQGLPPQPAVVIVSASLDLPLKDLTRVWDRKIYVATGEQADHRAINKIESSGVRVLLVGAGKTVEGGRLVDRLVAEGFNHIYSIAGPGVLETLLLARVLDRIYLTQVHRLLGGKSFDTLLQGKVLSPPADFRLQALYYDAQEGEGCGQFFSIYQIMPESRANGCD